MGHKMRDFYTFQKENEILCPVCGEWFKPAEEHSYYIKKIIRCLSALTLVCGSGKRVLSRSSLHRAEVKDQVKNMVLSELLKQARPSAVLKSVPSI